MRNEKKKKSHLEYSYNRSLLVTAFLCISRITGGWQLHFAIVSFFISLASFAQDTSFVCVFFLSHLRRKKNNRIIVIRHRVTLLYN